MASVAFQTLQVTAAASILTVTTPIWLSGYVARRLYVKLCPQHPPKTSKAELGMTIIWAVWPVSLPPQHLLRVKELQIKRQEAEDEMMTLRMHQRIRA